MKNRILPLFFAFALVFSGCVSTKKYQELSSEKDFLQASYAELKMVEEEKLHCETEKVKLQRSVKNTIQELEDLTAKSQSQERAQRDLLMRYEHLLSQNKALLASSSSEIKTLTETLSAQQDELDDRTRRQDSLQMELDYQQQSITDWQNRISVLQQALEDRDSRVRALNARINQALVGLTAADLTVTHRDGRLYVSLSQNLLFQSGSDQIDPKGKMALQQLAHVLSTNSDIKIVVEGHTDNVGSASFNWDLSTSRATAVVKVLADSGVDQKRMSASGRSFFQPIVPNDTEANKSKNRRVEIILSPNLDELYRLMKQ